MIIMSEKIKKNFYDNTIQERVELAIASPLSYYVKFKYVAFDDIPNLQYDNKNIILLDNIRKNNEIHNWNNINKEKERIISINRLIIKFSTQTTTDVLYALETKYNKSLDGLCICINKKVNEQIYFKNLETKEKKYFCSPYCLINYVKNNKKHCDSYEIIAYSRKISSTDTYSGDLKFFLHYLTKTEWTLRATDKERKSGITTNNTRITEKDDKLFIYNSYMEFYRLANYHGYWSLKDAINIFTYLKMWIDKQQGNSKLTDFIGKTDIDIIFATFVKLYANSLYEKEYEIELFGTKVKFTNPGPF